MQTRPRSAYIIHGGSVEALNLMVCKRYVPGVVHNQCANPYTSLVAVLPSQQARPRQDIVSAIEKAVRDIRQYWPHRQERAVQSNHQAVDSAARYERRPVLLQPLLIRAQTFDTSSHTFVNASWLSLINKCKVPEGNPCILFTSWKQLVMVSSKFLSRCNIRSDGGLEKSSCFAFKEHTELRPYETRTQPVTRNGQV